MARQPPKLVEKDLLGDDAAAMQVEDELASKSTGARGDRWVPRNGVLRQRDIVPVVNDCDVKETTVYRES